MSYSKIKSTQRLVFCDIFGAHSVQFNSKHKNISWVFYMLRGASAIVISAVVNSQKTHTKYFSSYEKTDNF